ISVNPTVPVSTLSELIAYARARPGQLHYAVDGSAIFQSVVGRYFTKRAKIELVEVGYRSTAQALQDTVAGFTQMSITQWRPVHRSPRKESYGASLSPRKTAFPE